MRILVTGGTGLVGRRLVADRLARGDEVVVLSRDADRARRRFGGDGPAPEVVEGDPTVRGPWQRAVAEADAVVHLAGAGVADRRWSPRVKRTILESRVQGTTHVAEAIRDAADPPRTWVSASAVGVYGERGEDVVTEDAPLASEGAGDFLADVGHAWERSTAPAADATRIVRFRIGLVLDERGGLLGRLVPIFRLGGGGPIGAGRFFMPVVHWGDLVDLADLALRDASITGPLNAVGPEPVRNVDFSRALGRVLHRPALLPVPRLALRLVLGEMAPYTWMSQRVVPARALAAGHQPRFPDVEAALRDLLGS